MSIEDVCNQALDGVGYPRPIGSIWEGTRAARLALDVWAETRDVLLRNLRPDWSIKDEVLTLDKSAPANGYAPGTPWTDSYPPIPWLYEYDAPDDCLHPLQVKAQPIVLPVWRPRAIPFRVTVGYTILTNQADAVLTYISRVLDPDDWHEDFVEAMVQALMQKFQSLSPQPQRQERQDADPA